MSFSILLCWVLLALRRLSLPHALISEWVDLIPAFYRQMDSHLEWQHISSSVLCDEHNVSVYPRSSASDSNIVYNNHKSTHFNERHITYIPMAMAYKHISQSPISLSIEYSALNRGEHMHHSECVHYNFTADININSVSRCISRISNVEITHFFPDHGSEVCQPVPMAYQALQLQPRVLLESDDNDTSAAYVAAEFTFDFFDHSNILLMLVGSLCCLVWCTFNILYHIALLHYPSIFYTKICVFTLFLSALANITISVLIVDPFSFVPNAVGIILCMLQFLSWAYDLHFDFTAPYCSYFVTLGPHRKQPQLRANAAEMKPVGGHEVQTSQSTKTHAHFRAASASLTSMASEDTVASSSQLTQFSPTTKLRSRVTARYRGRGSETAIVKIVSIGFVLASILVHFVVLFISEEAEHAETSEDLRQVRFDQAHGLLLLQWLVCLSVMIAWFQNFRFEYAFQTLLADGHYNHSDGIQSMPAVSTEQASLAASNDSYLLSADIFGDEEDDAVEMNEPSACCKCLHGCSLNVVNLIRFLPWLLCVNGVCWIVFGIFICKLEILWLQHALSVGVGGIYVVVSLCMNEKNLILAKKAAAMQHGGGGGGQETLVEVAEPPDSP